MAASFPTPEELPEIIITLSFSKSAWGEYLKRFINYYNLKVWILFLKEIQQ